MLIESAFTYLPEILTGSNYAAQDYEAGIVNAVSLAVLQELNARNIPNPLSALTVEKLYNPRGFDRPDGNPKRRYLRADLFMNIAGMEVATNSLGRFGWRHHNYLEAKYFRPNGPSSTVNNTQLFADIIRLCCLVPPTVMGIQRNAQKTKGKNAHLIRYSPVIGKNSPDRKYKEICVSRYLLHVYEGDIDGLMGKKSFPWAGQLRRPGPVSINVDVSEDDRKTFTEGIGLDINDLQLSADFTNLVITQQPGEPQYTCVLSRIERFTVTLDGISWTEGPDRTGEESEPGGWKKIQAKVGKHLLFTASGMGTKADDVEPNENELNKSTGVDDGSDETSEQS